MCSRSEARVTLIFSARVDPCPRRAAGAPWQYGTHQPETVAVHHRGGMVRVRSGNDVDDAEDAGPGLPRPHGLHGAVSRHAGDRRCRWELRSGAIRRTLGPVKGRGDQWTTCPRGSKSRSAREDPVRCRPAAFRNRVLREPRASCRPRQRRPGQVDSHCGKSCRARVSSRNSAICPSCRAPAAPPIGGSTNQYNFRMPLGECCCANSRASAMVNSHTQSESRATSAKSWAGQVWGKSQPRLNWPLPPAGFGAKFVLT